MSLFFSKIASPSLRHHLRRLYSTTPTTSTSSDKIGRIADELLTLSPSELSDFSTLLRLRLGVSLISPSSAGPASVSGSGAEESVEAEQEKEKTVFDVRLDKFDAAAKIKVIKEVRGFTDLGLKEAKELVEKTPVVVKKGLTKEEAEAIAAKLKAVGASVVLE
ncbi:50S ribosomal protein L7/L12 [Rhynchospora pubera]|uniref:50S ribosomal protein L7/L12 n=1 Tax=Rhynchospora pubera TaxID=906938 RepID=A0AAV8C1W9_9POAL|nr:50S ribosomal protein L7/L12 [Rhynchospora pubera]KAJ4768676.1 50S ribosomal protein L7/L12 [Rhynchospora pubera]KAJ4821415.1 50S ribosomal protein L7/L12 [Rhynchospora pubera]